MTDFDQATKAAATVTQTWWISFYDGRRFLGVAIVDVDDEDATEAEELIRNMRARRGIVTGALDDKARYIGGALRVAHLMGCNPGSAAETVRIDTNPAFKADDAAGKFPRNRLMSMAELKRVGAVA